MARPTSSGLPYLHLRSESGKYAYWRTLPTDVSIHVAGKIELPWARQNHELVGNKVVKVSLKTGDEATARERWGQVHSQVEAFVRQAIAKARQAPPDKRTLKKVDSLTPAEIATIASQTRHDILASQDQAWIEPDKLSAIARAITRLQKDDGNKFTSTEAREVERRMDQRAVTSILKSGDVSALDARVIIYEGRWADEEASTSAKPKVLLDDPGELTARLQENGLEFVGPETERRRLALPILRAKGGALREADARNQGHALETPTRPDPIVAALKTPNEDCEKKTLLEMHDIWKDSKRPGQKAIDDNRVYVERFISLHGDLPIGDIRPKHIREFREVLRKTPRSMPKEIATKPLRDIVAWGETHSKQFLSRRTINNKGIGAISALFATAVNETYVETNPCTLDATYQM
jgi:hypothetical protein